MRGLGNKTLSDPFVMGLNRGCLSKSWIDLPPEPTDKEDCVFEMNLILPLEVLKSSFTLPIVVRIHKHLYAKNLKRAQNLSHLNVISGRGLPYWIQVTSNAFFLLDRQETST